MTGSVNRFIEPVVLSKRYICPKSTLLGLHLGGWRKLENGPVRGAVNARLFGPHNPLFLQRRSSRRGTRLPDEAYSESRWCLPANPETALAKGQLSNVVQVSVVREILEISCSNQSSQSAL
jgi:hypothetical protein